MHQNIEGIHLHLGKIAEWEQVWKEAIQHYEAEEALIQQPPEKEDEHRHPRRTNASVISTTLTP